MSIPQTQKRKESPSRREPQAGSLRWRGTIIALVGSLAASLVCLGLLDTLVAQIAMMIPHGASREEGDVIKAAHAAWRSDWRINNTVAQWYVLSKRDPTENELAQWASARDNSLGIWADLLVRLRRAGVGPANENATQPAAETRPAPDESILSLIQSLEYARPLRIGVGPLHDVFVAAAMDKGLSARRAEAVFWPEWYGSALAAYRPVLRELSGRLLALGRQYEAAGRSADAVRTYRAAIRALTDAVQDSPLPEVALLAAGQAEPIARELARLQGGGGAPAAEPLIAFQRVWVDVPDRDLAMIPATFGPALSPDLHRSLLASLTAGAGLLTGGWMLAILCLALLIVVGATRPFGRVPLGWRWGGWGAAVAPAIVIVPTVLLVLVLASDAVPFIWLASARSVRALILTPAIMILVWMLATRLCLRPTAGHEKAVVPWPVVAGGAGLVLAALVIGGLVPLHGEPWRPSAGAQLFRRLVGAVGLVSIGVTLVWAGWGWRRRRQAHLPAGVWARGGLAVASAAMFVMLLFAAIGLAINQQRDRRYEAAFVRDIKDPIAARLGADWWPNYFGPARSLVE